MLPFITLFGIKIPMYGMMIVTGIAIGVFLAAWFPSKKGIARQDIFYSSCFAGIGAMVGAKLLYLAVTVPQMMSQPNPPVMSLALLTELLSYGFIFYGGVLGGLLGIFIYARLFKLSFFTLSELLIPSVPLIHAIGRIGCFCAGCCYGRPMDPPWGVHFHADSVAPQGVALFPVQLLESGINLILFAAIFIYSRRERRAGQILGFYLTFYAIERFVLEYFRYDEVRGFLFGISTSQWISILLLPVGIYLLLRPRLQAFLADRRQAR